MGTWRDGWYIFLKDLKTGRYYLIWNVLFMLYMGLTTSFIFSSEDRVKHVINPLGDFMLLLLVPLAGFTFCRRSFRYLKDDSYTQMLYYYRMLPIPLGAVIKARLLQTIFAFSFNSCFFFGLMLWLSAPFWGDANFSAYVAFALTWIGYGLMITSGYMYFEFLKRGIVYMWVSFIANGIIASLAFIVEAFSGNLVRFVMDYAKQYGLLSPVMWGSLIIGGLLIGINSKIILRKLAVRDLA
ncbi:hypothetical protein [Paenibacillus tuaregi]|uniref:hypothetical protein n=1 Tax=Paenibacillus tuaregi TaxID=1816681 RepID=UPI000838ABC9|nr:hypothetical protein [Paenibacillus tuaregi]